MIMPIDDPDSIYKAKVINISEKQGQSEYEQIMNKDDIMIIDKKSFFDQNGNYFVAIEWREPKIK